MVQKTSNRHIQAVMNNLVSLRRVPWTTQTFAEGSAAEQKLKNTALG